MTFFISPARNGENEMELFARGALQAVAVSEGERCSSPQEAFAVYDTPHGALFALNPALAYAPYADMASAPLLDPPIYERTISYQYDSLYRLTDAAYCSGYVAECPSAWALRRYHYVLRLRSGCSYDLRGNPVSLRSRDERPHHHPILAQQPTRRRLHLRLLRQQPALPPLRQPHPRL